MVTQLPPPRGEALIALRAMQDDTLCDTLWHVDMLQCSRVVGSEYSLVQSLPRVSSVVAKAIVTAPKLGYQFFVLLFSPGTHFQNFLLSLLDDPEKILSFPTFQNPAHVFFSGQDLICISSIPLKP